MPKNPSPKKVPSVAIVRKMLRQTGVVTGIVEQLTDRRTTAKPSGALPPRIPPESAVDSGALRPAQSPPEVAPAFSAPGIASAVVSLPVNEEELLSTMRGESIVNASENLRAWQEVVPRRLARSYRSSSQASPAMSGRKSPRILHLSDVNSPMSFAVMTSSTSPVPSENSDLSSLPFLYPGYLQLSSYL